MESKKINVNGTTLAYQEQGSGNPVVLLHGFCGSSRYWEKVIPALSDKYRVIVPDLRGHGQSNAPSGPYEMEAFASDIEALLQELGIAKTVVLGHSLGGYITLALAEKNPGLLAGWGLVHSTAHPDSEEGKANRLKGIETIDTKGLPEFIEGLVPKLFAPEHLEPMAAAVEDVKVIGRETSPEGAKATLEGMRRRPDRNHVLENAQVPVLLAAGTEDKVIVPDKTFSVDRPSITKVTIDGSGHMSMYEAPDQLIAGLTSFLGRLY
ncbi:alpha/beta hydrolase [Paenibacillus sp. CC-CFT747]|nr:alpha/beta hydrolase [Paenibacillus sp. CC-CFT747]